MMAIYHAKSTNGLSFEVSKDSEVIGQLTYSSWFKFNAAITILETTYPVEPKGFWDTSIDVRDGEKVLLSFSMGWRGQIVLQTYFNDAEEEYVFNHRGVFRESFVLTDRAGTELLVMKPQLKWAMMNYEYELTTTDAFEALPDKHILLLTALHCANYYLSMMTGIMAT